MADVIKLEPRRPPALTHVDVRLADEGRHLVLTLYDAQGTVAGVLAYGLECIPDGFDLSRLVDAWAGWREQSDWVS